jgi:type IV pilus assembly protein PilZ
MSDRFNGGSGPSTMARPGVLSLNIREKAALYAAYMPYLKGGGIFIPTNRQYQLGEEVFMLLSLMDDPQRIAVQGKVVWHRRAVHQRRDGRLGADADREDPGRDAGIESPYSHDVGWCVARAVLDVDRPTGCCARRTNSPR